MTITVQKKIEQLKKEILRHQHLYYVLNQPEISDREYDRLFDELLKLEAEYPEYKTADSPTQRIGSDLDNSFEEARLPVELLSLDKVYQINELLEWMIKLEKNENSSFIGEQKIDGASILLHYNQGILQAAYTRGNGTIGNIVTENIKTIRQVPLNVFYKKEFAVRGEIYIDRKDFAELNRQFENRFANPRNLAAGTLRQLKSSSVSRIPLQIFAYDLFLLADSPFDHLQSIKLLTELGFRVNQHFAFFSNSEEKKNRFEKIFPHLKAKSIEDIKDWVADQLQKRSQLGYEIDGLVLKVNEPEVRKKLGSTSHHPRYALAFKFEAPAARTIVKEIVVQIGRNGRVTPVALLEPVKIAGTTVTRATLHNQEYIALLELNTGDLVAVSKRGDIIPAVEKVLEKRNSGEPFFKLPSSCPFCNSPLVIEGGHHFCKNEDCPERKKRALIHFCSKNGLDIEGLGEETINFLFRQNLVKEIPDLYTFDYNQLLKFKGFKEKKIQHIKQSLEQSKTRGFERVLQALGIEGLGETGIKRLFNAGLTSIDQFLQIAGNNNVEKLTAIAGIGELTARNLIRQLQDRKLRQLIEKLRQLGLQFVFKKEEVAANGQAKIFSNQVWVLTGSFANFRPRQKAAQEIIKRGGEVADSISSKTTHLLVGAEPGSKLQKAQVMGITIVDEDEFLKLLSK